MINKVVLLWFLALSIGCTPSNKVRTRDAKTLQKGVQTVQADAKAKAEAEAQAQAQAQMQAQAQTQSQQAQADAKAKADADAKAKADADAKAKADAQRASIAVKAGNQGSAASTASDASAATTSTTNQAAEVKIAPQQTDAPAASNAFTDALAEAKKNVKPIPEGKPQGSKGKSEQDQLAQMQKDSAEKARAKLEKASADAEKKESVFKSEEERAQWAKLTEYVAELGIPQETPTGLFFTVTDSTSQNEKEPRVINQISIVGGPDEKGNINFTRVQAAWSNVTKDADGNMINDMWSMLLSRDAKLAKFIHGKLTTNKEGRVTGPETIETTDAAAEEKWTEMRGYWLKRLDSAEKKELDTKEKAKFDAFMEKLKKEEEARKAKADGKK